MGSNEEGLPAGKVRNDNAVKGLVDGEEKDGRRREWPFVGEQNTSREKPHGRQNNNVMSRIQASRRNAC